MSEGVVAERYARALFELGSAAGNLPVLAEKLREFSKVFSGSSALRQSLENPVVSSAQREAILTDVARRVGVPDLGIKGLLVMARRRRLFAVAALASRLLELADEKNGVLRAQVITAQKMPESYYQTLSARLSAATSRKIVLERSEDPSLIGGAITKIGDRIIDGSLKGRLDAVEQKLLGALNNHSAS